MANVLLTTTCNLSCSYCFAQERMKEKGRQHMAMDDVSTVIGFLKRSNDPTFRMMGGEPTLHPDFVDIVHLALAEGMSLDLLSNATWPAEYNTLFQEISPTYLRFLLNIDHPDSYSKETWEKVRGNLSSISGRKGISLSFNMFEKRPRYQYVLDLASEFRVNCLRLSFSLPVVGTQNAALPLEDYFEMPEVILEIVRKAEVRGIKVHLDNAVPFCLFSFEQVGELLLKGVLDLERNARCRPIIDISPDLTVCNCFCLSKLHNKKLEDFSCLEEVQRYYEELFRPYQERIFPFEKCYDCDYQKLWGCQGGCTTFSFNKANESGFPERYQKPPSVDDTKVLALADDVVVLRHTMPGVSYTLRNNKGKSIEMGSSFEILLQLLQQQKSVADMLLTCLPKGEDASPTPLDFFQYQTLSEGLKNMLSGLMREGFLCEPAKAAIRSS